MFKEADAPLLGWEVYARKDDILSELGIALVANATAIACPGQEARGSGQRHGIHRSSTRSEIRGARQ